FDVEHGAFTWGWAPRQKTKRPQLLEVPAMLRPILHDWWQRHGKPQTGVVFPSRRGERVGEAKGKASHANAFRRDLRRAFGIDEATRVETTRRNGRKLTKTVWKQCRELTPREHELFIETDFTLPVDFHSWRRAFSQALADADVNAQQATALTGHASLAAHARYLANSGKLRRLPTGALPKLGVLSVPRTELMPPKLPRGENFNDSQWAEQGSNLRHPACKFVQSNSTTQETASIRVDALGVTRPETAARPAADRTHGQNSPPPWLDAQIADVLLGVALQRMAVRIGAAVAGG
ncbi:MAG TPA: hypothetical protein PKD61_04450, partial [Polyangiaceae bacterium]|nr:hypothetical protein [Polyangiaceae bacterium]